MGKISPTTTTEQQIREEIRIFPPPQIPSVLVLQPPVPPCTGGRHGTIPEPFTERCSFLCHRSNTAAWQPPGPGSIPRPLKHSRGRLALPSTETRHGKATSDRQRQCHPQPFPCLPGSALPAPPSQPPWGARPGSGRSELKRTAMLSLKTSACVSTSHQI